MFANQPSNPQIVAQILSLSEGWKELLGPEVEAEKPARKRRNTGKRKVKA
jgi:hypothetical protein